MQRRILFVLGGPGSGKGTLCANLQRLYPGQFGFHSAGKLIREKIDQGKGPFLDKKSKELALKLEQIILNGKIIPSEVTVSLLLDKVLKEMNEVVLIDGFPRNKENYEVWTKATASLPEIKCMGALYLDLSQRLMIERIKKRASLNKEARSDDQSEETIIKRLRTHEVSSSEVLRIYKEKMQLFKIDASKSEEGIVNEARKILTELDLIDFSEKYSHEQMVPAFEGIS